jgi:threonine dehydrogenase-like Zn-dependent dehydrogenase
MKALIYRGSHVLEFSDAADPVPQPDEVLVAVEAVGICGSDMHACMDMTSAGRHRSSSDMRLPAASSPVRARASG